MKLSLSLTKECEMLVCVYSCIYVVALSDQLLALRSLTLISWKNTAARAKTGPRIKYPDYSQASHVYVWTPHRYQNMFG